MHPFLICDHISRMLQERHTFLQYIEDISVIKSNKNNNLQGKTLRFTDIFLF